MTLTFAIVKLTHVYFLLINTTTISALILALSFILIVFTYIIIIIIIIDITFFVFTSATASNSVVINKFTYISLIDNIIIIIMMIIIVIITAVHVALRLCLLQLHLSGILANFRNNNHIVVITVIWSTATTATSTISPFLLGASW